MIQPWVTYVEEAKTALELMQAWLLLETSINPRWLEPSYTRWGRLAEASRSAGVANRLHFFGLWRGVSVRRLFHDSGPAVQDALQTDVCGVDSAEGVMVHVAQGCSCLEIAR